MVVGLFAEALKSAFTRAVRGQDEDQLKRPTCELLEAFGRNVGLSVATTTELSAGDGRPDIGVIVGELLCGHIELKAPTEVVDPERMRGRNRIQWEKFQALPNLIYTNGREWRLFRQGEQVARVTFEGEPTSDGESAVSEASAARLGQILTSFLGWQPIIPADPKELARFLAPLTRVLRDDVREALRQQQETLVALRDEWRAFLFPDVEDDQFADAYAQTVVSALLLARIEGADIRNPAEAQRVLRAENSLLGRILQILTQEEVRDHIRLGLSVVERCLLAIYPEVLNYEARDPWLYFYEDFLRAYDKKLATDAGVYYTPAQVVRFQVGLVADLLRNRFGKQYTFADEGVTTLDPAVGTGTYLVGAIQNAQAAVRERAGAQWESRAEVLRQNLIGFEALVGPYAVAHLRLTRELIAFGGEERRDRTLAPVRVFLADTLQSPVAPSEGVIVPVSHRPLVAERENARRVKAEESVLVCIGNPPYDRQMEEGAERKGGWVRFGDHTQEVPILTDFIEPTRQAGEGANIRSIYNDYVYFWRWAIWKVCDQKQGSNSPGIVSFITASSYLNGPGVIGMREYMRRAFDEIWIVDLGGDSRGARKEPNVFDIQTPVAIAMGLRSSRTRADTAAAVRYFRIRGTRAEKFARLESIAAISEVTWRDCPTAWDAPFKPELEGAYSAWPTLDQLFPWQHNGAQFVRTWPIGETQEVLRERWAALTREDSNGRRRALKETRDKTIAWTSDVVALPGASGPALAALPATAPPPEIIRYSFRSFDRQYALFDARLGDYLKPPIWAGYSDRQVYLTTALAFPIGVGPAAVFSAHIPDLHHFCGRGGKDLIPLYRDRECLRPNVTRGLAETLSAMLGVTISAEDIFYYSAGVLGSTAFTSKFWTELETPGIHVPVTKQPELFHEVAQLGRTIIGLHTFGERPVAANAGRGVIAGSARIQIDIPVSDDRYPVEFNYVEDGHQLLVGDGVISGVSTDIWNFEVSGLRVVRSWLSYRMADGAGRSSSPLDAIRPRTWSAALTNELLEVLWTVEALLEISGPAANLLDRVIDGPLFTAAELPMPDPQQRREPRMRAAQHDLV